MRWSPVVLYVALLVFLSSSIAVLMSLENGSRLLAVLGAIGHFVAAVIFGLSMWLPRKRVDWDRIEAEQRLWESGPLGRKWLRVRQRITDRWKL